MENYIKINKKTWDNKTDVHVASAFYDNNNFLEGKSTLNAIELQLLGDISNKKILHLQCHFGQDSLSLSRLGAHVTGVDFSNNAIKKAKEFNNQLNLNTRFICCDLHDLPTFLEEQFDIVLRVMEL